jgi:hypothetical protein
MGAYTQLRRDQPAGEGEVSSPTVEVTFTAASPGVTVVELVHTGWERRPDGADARSNYDSGWDVVLGRYVRRIAY